MGSELSTLGLFCSGRPPDLVRYVSPAALAAWASPEEELLLAAKAQKRDLELAPFAGFSCGLKERKTWPLWFAPFRVAEIWPELLIEEDDRRLAR